MSGLAMCIMHILHAVLHVLCTADKFSNVSPDFKSKLYGKVCNLCWTIICVFFLILKFQGHYCFHKYIPKFQDRQHEVRIFCQVYCWRFLRRKLRLMFQYFLAHVTNIFWYDSTRTQAKIELCTLQPLYDWNQYKTFQLSLILVVQ